MSNTLPKKILIIGPAWVGDMVMAQTLCRYLKHRDSAVQIDMVAPLSTHALLSRMPEIAHTYQLPAGHGELALRARYILAKRCRYESYDQAIVLANTFKSALIPYFARIPVRTGWRRELRQVLLNDSRALDKQKYPLMIERFVALAEGPQHILGELAEHWPRFSISKADVHKALEKVGLDKVIQKVLAICPGAEFGAAKRWPQRHYAAVAQHFLSQGGSVWIFGGQGDREVAKAIMEMTNQACVDLTGKTTLPEAIDLLSLSSVVITNDSGLMHIAAALDKPQIVLYGSSSPGFTPPLSHKAKILSLNLACSPCFERECPLGHLKCLHDLQPTKVITVLDELLTV